MKPVAKGLLRILGSLFLLLLVVLAVAGIVQSSRSGEQTETVTPFSFDPYGENRFTPVGRGMLVTSDAGLTLLTRRGRPCSPAPRRTPNPSPPPAAAPPPCGARTAARPS